MTQTARRAANAAFAFAFVALLGVSSRATAGEAARVEKDIPYRTAADPGDAYAQEVCKLDLYLPEQPKTGFPLVVWFHGGGLTSGQRGEAKLAGRFNARGIALATAGYRLSPRATFPAYLEDAARAVAWAVGEGVKRGADPDAIFVSGHSAGAYVAAMLAMDERYLKAAGVPAGRVAGYVPVSGQMLTHYTVRIERGLTKQHIVADEAAPMYHARKDAPPILLLVGDRDMALRLAENQLFHKAMTDGASNKTTELLVVPDRDHGGIGDRLLTEGDPGGEAFVAFVERWKNKRQ